MDLDRLLARRDEPGVERADAVLQAKLSSLANVTVVTSAQTTEVTGDGSRVTGLVYRDRVGGGVQVNGRRLIEPYAHGDDPVEQHRGMHRLAEDT